MHLPITTINIALPLLILNVRVIHMTDFNKQAIDSVYARSLGGRGFTQMREQYISFCSENEVILTSWGGGQKGPKPACVLN